MDNPRHIASVPSRGSISSGQVSRVFSAEVELTTSRCHRVLASALLDSGANSCFMDHQFTVMHSIQLHKLPSPVSVGVIDGRPIASGDIVEESEPIRVVLGNLASVISFNIISSPEHSLVLQGLPWFELHNPTIDWRKRTVEEITVQSESRQIPTRDMGSQKIPTISIPQLREEGRKEDMFLFAVLATPTSSSQELGVQLPKKYTEFSDVFDKVKANRLPEHRPYDCPIDL